MRITKLFFICFILLLVCACSVTPEEMEKGKSLCEPNGGLKNLSILGGRIHACCNNGATFNNTQNIKAN